jgi:hypothetical protein
MRLKSTILGVKLANAYLHFNILIRFECIIRKPSLKKYHEWSEFP